MFISRRQKMSIGKLSTMTLNKSAQDKKVKSMRHCLLRRGCEFVIYITKDD
jgi:hypothetical protein